MNVNVLSEGTRSCAEVCQIHELFLPEIVNLASKGFLREGAGWESGEGNAESGNGNEVVKSPLPVASGGISWLGVWVTVIWIVAKDLDFESDPALMRFVELIYLCSQRLEVLSVLSFSNLLINLR